jgi:hypothetical protein
MFGSGRMTPSSRGAPQGNTHVVQTQTPGNGTQSSSSSAGREAITRSATHGPTASTGSVGAPTTQMGDYHQARIALFCASLDPAAVLRCQKMVRGWLARRAFRKLVYAFSNTHPALAIKHRNQALKEIIDTEKSYVHSLEILQTVLFN